MLYRILIVAALAVPMFARDYDDDDRDWRRNDGYYGRDNNYRRDRNRDSGYSNDTGYGYGYGNPGNYSRGGSSILNQTMRDLQSAASRSRVDGHERNHFNRAMSELQQMSYRSQQGRVDTGRLNRVLE